MNIFIISLIIPILLLFLFTKIIKPSSSSSSTSSSSSSLPPGSLGIPIIGQSLSLLRAMRSNTAEQWIEQRIQKYGPISKLNLFGKPSILMYGAAANKFLFTNEGGGVLSNHQTQSLKMLLGDRNMMELSGEDHKRVRNVVVSFLKRESLREYVEKMDDEVMKHLEMHWEGNHKVTVLPLMKSLTIGIICSLLFGLERGKQRDDLKDNFEVVMKAAWAIPVNLPFTRFNRGLRESSRIQSVVKDLIRRKKIELERNGASPRQDLITYLLGMPTEDGKEKMTEEEIIHNVMLIMVAGHDTSSILITFLIRLMANEPSVYAAVLQEQEEIAKSKQREEPLSWEDLTKMKYTWRVALETLRMVPPVFGGFRKTVKDIEYEGYLIPKGWQIFWVAAMTHMDSSIFPEPSKFDPSRFENQASIPPYCFIAFGGGQRICPGYEFAKFETLVAIHYLVTRFTWKLCADNTFIRDPTPIPSQGLPIQINPRVLS